MDEKINIKISTIDGSLELEVPINASVGAIKGMVFEHLGLDESALGSYDLVYKGNTLKVNETIEESNINGDVDLKLIKNDIKVAY